MAHTCNPITSLRLSGITFCVQGQSALYSNILLPKLQTNYTQNSYDDAHHRRTVEFQALFSVGIGFPLGMNGKKAMVRKWVH